MNKDFWSPFIWFIIIFPNSLSINELRDSQQGLTLCYLFGHGHIVHRYHNQFS